MDTPLLIAGLGNPGSQYAKNRHNAGFIVADELHAHYRFGPWKTKFEGLLSEGSLAGRKTWLLKPQTFMNLSGDSVGPALRFFKLPLESLVVVHDEIDLAAGKLKVKTGGGDAGQNGLRSITAACGANYRRVRLGIGHPGDKERVTGHVLQNFSIAILFGIVVGTFSSTYVASMLLLYMPEVGGRTDSKSDGKEEATA